MFDSWCRVQILGFSATMEDEVNYQALLDAHSQSPFSKGFSSLGQMVGLGVIAIGFAVGEQRTWSHRPTLVWGDCSLIYFT